MAAQDLDQWVPTPNACSSTSSIVDYASSGTTIRVLDCVQVRRPRPSETLCNIRSTTLVSLLQLSRWTCQRRSGAGDTSKYVTAFSSDPLLGTQTRSSACPAFASRVPAGLRWHQTYDATDLIAHGRAMIGPRSSHMQLMSCYHSRLWYAVQRLGRPGPSRKPANTH